jgi:hypothetical protein
MCRQLTDSKHGLSIYPCGAHGFWHLVQYRMIIHLQWVNDNKEIVQFILIIIIIIIFSVYKNSKTVWAFISS